MTSRPPPRTRSTLSRRSVSTSRNSMSAQLSRRTNYTLEHRDSPVPSLSSASRACSTDTSTPEPGAGGSLQSQGARESHPCWHCVMGMVTDPADG